MPDFLAFTLIVLPFIMSPGASLILTLSNASTLGIKGVFSVVVGASLGLICHAFIAGFGLQLASSQPWLLSALSIVGKLFLLYMGAKLIYAGYLTYRHNIELKAACGIKEAFALNVFNAKALSLYFTVVPAFAGSALSGFVMLAAWHIVLITTWLFLCAFIFVYLKQKSSLKTLILFTNVIGGAGLLVFAIAGLYASS